MGKRESRGGYKGGSTVLGFGSNWFTGNLKSRNALSEFDDRSVAAKPKSELEKRVERNLIANRESARREKALPAAPSQAAPLSITQPVSAPIEIDQNPPPPLQLSPREVRARQAALTAARNAIRRFAVISGKRKS